MKLWSYLPPGPLLRQYAAKYDPKIPGADVDRALDEAAGRLFDSHSPGAFGAKGYSGFGSYGAASEPELFASRSCSAAKGVKGSVAEVFADDCLWMCRNMMKYVE